MSRIAPLNMADHGALCFDRNAAGATRQIVQLGLSEIAFAAADMPLCLAKDANTGRFDLIALLGLVEPTNLFSFGGHFQATYIPRAALLTGFRLDPNGAAGLAVDVADPTIGTDGEPLFADGRPAPLLGHLHQALEQVMADIAAARTLIARYAAKRLVRPLILSVRKADGRDHDIAGLYTIDEPAMRALPDDEVVALHRADALAPSTILSASLAQIERLRQLHNARFEPAISSCSIG
ncbi:SapC family protein [Sphingomonas mollis]|uniref:SapC family protein n=1 Tax=Sphingomonas mollis TaxID=2795726 RepID=A0ABS0XQP5_9SPHN|nr:SapC family protein [Sphingomonas sp. BT553]MBJ6122367.1 SapC family protein [Sphingomonas sp. BT553]